MTVVLSEMRLPLVNGLGYFNLLVDKSAIAKKRYLADYTLWEGIRPE